VCKGPKWPFFAIFDDFHDFGPLSDQFYRDFNNKLHKVNGVFRPLQCFKRPEILYLIITRMEFLKIENKNLTITQVEEL
jgi:hypothetical protein